MGEVSREIPPRPRFGGIAPLLLNGYALVANAGLSAVLGIVFWMVATRLFSQENVGLAAALIASMMTISHISQMNLSEFLARFLPAAGTGAGRLIARTYALPTLAALVIATGFALGIGYFAEPLEFIRDSWGALLFFVIATALWTLFALQDASLSGLRRSALVPVKNTAYAALKIGMLVGLGLAAFSSPLGIFVAWMIPVIPVLIVTNLIIQRNLPRRAPPGGDRVPNFRSAFQFVGWDFLGSISLDIGFGLATLMVTASVGAESAATYQLAWSATYSVYLLGRAMSVSLVVEGANQPMRLRRLAIDSLGHTLFLVLGAVAFIVVFAPWIMGLFGPDYVREGTPVLRVLILSCVPWAINSTFCAVARVQHETRSVAIVQIGTLVILASVSALLIGEYGTLGVAIGWLAAHSIVLGGIVLRTIHKEGWQGPVDWLLALVGSAIHLAHSLPVTGMPFSSSRQQRPLPREVQALIENGPLAGLKMTPLDNSRSDIDVIQLCSNGVLKAVLKYSQMRDGIEEIEGNAQVLKALAANDRIRSLSGVLPRIIAEKRWQSGYCMVETAVPGIEGSNMHLQDDRLPSAMVSAVSALAELHRLTAQPGTLDDEWAKRWIDEPIEAVSHVAGRSYPGADDSLGRLREWLREVFVGRTAHLGLGHGDAWLGNMFFAAGDGEARLSGLIDWGGSRSDALAALDVCLLVLNLRMQQRGEELGRIVSELLRGDPWSPEEMEYFRAGGLATEFIADVDDARSRGILILTWLGHVTKDPSRSDPTRVNRFWSIVNVDRVLSAIDHSQPQGVH